MGTYVEISKAEMNKTLEDCGFVETDYRFDLMAQEEVWERQVVSSTGKEFPFTVVIYTTIDKRTGVSRKVGGDAIRLILWDDKAERPIMASEKRVFRTKSALSNMKERARELFRFVFEAPLCECGGIMVERCSKKPGAKPFLGCSRFSPNGKLHCAKTRNY